MGNSRKIVNYDSSAGDKKNNEKEIMKQKMLEIMHRYRTGDPEEVRWAKEALLSEIAGFLGMAIKKYAPNFAKDYYHEMYNECVIAVLENMEKFDPEKGTATTFFTAPVIHALSNYSNMISNKSTAYYSQNMNKIRSALAYFEKIQMKPSLSDLALHTGLSVQKVEQGLNRIYATDEVYIATEAELDAVLKRESKSPEEECIEKERSQILKNAMAGLTKMDRYLLMLHFGFDEDKQLSLATIAKRTGIPVNQVSNSIARSLRILADNTELAALAGKSPARKRQRAVNRTETELLPNTNIINLFGDCLDEDFEDFEEPIASGQNVFQANILKF